MASSARIEELKEKFDENPRRYFAPLANELRKQGDLSQAISICRTHLPNQPGHLSGHIVLAQALYEATDFEESRAEFQAALALDPENLIALRFMGDLSSASGDVDGARGWYQRVLDAEPRNYEIARIMRDLDAPPNEHAGAHQPLESRTAHATPVETRAESPEPEPSPLASSVPQQQVGAHVQELSAELSAEAAAVSEAAAPEPAVNRDGDAGDTPMVIDFPNVAHRSAEKKDRPPAGSLDTRWDAEASSASEMSDFEAAPEDWFTDPADPAEELAGDYKQEEAFREAAPEAAHGGADNDIELLFAKQGGAPPEAGAVLETDAPTESPRAAAHADIPSIDFDEVEDAFGAQSTGAGASPSPSDAAMPPGNPITVAGDSTTPVVGRATVEDVPAVAEGDSVARTSAHEQAQDLAADDDASTRAAAPPKLFDDQPSRDADRPTSESQWWEPFVPTPLIDQASSTPAHEAQEQRTRNADHIEATMRTPVDTRIARTPEYVETVPESNAAPFVTETLAELYLQQGFRDEALAIYRQLLQRNPSDDTLRNRVAAIESGSGSYALDAAAQSHGPHQEVSSAQSVRTFFGTLAKRPPRRRASVSASGPLRRTGEFPAQSASAEGPSSLARLFNAPALSREDQDAAAALATAFNSPAVNAGPSSRPPDQKLSLDHLFRDPASSAATGESLDDFYAAPKGGANSSPNESGPPDDRAADIRQFTSWLEGLKKK